MIGDESDRNTLTAQSRIAPADALPTQFYTLRECRSLFKWNLAFLLGMVAIGVVTANSVSGIADAVSVIGVTVVIVAFGSINLFELEKMRHAICSGSHFPKRVPHVPKRFELWLEPLFVVLLTTGLIWLTKIGICRWLLHPAVSPIMFAFSAAALLCLCVLWVFMLGLVWRDYRLYFVAKHATRGNLACVMVNETADTRAAAADEKNETLARKPHWWTDTQAREEAKVTVQR